MSDILNNLMNHTLQPSLQRMTLTKTAVLLWNSEFSSFQRILLDAPKLILKREMQIVYDRVLGKVPHLLVPKTLKQKVSCIIKPVGRIIFDWLFYHHKHCRISGVLPKDLCWTPQGTIDKKKTAEILIRNENLDITNRYLVACFYCLEDEIPGLWRRIPNNVRNTEDFMKPAFITFWTHSMNSNFERTPSFATMLDHAVSAVNETAVSYFLPKLTPSEKEEFNSRFLITCPDTFKKCDSPHEKQYFFDILCALLSQMTEEQQDHFFRAPYSFIVLKYFLDWPRQDFFMKMANCLWNYICNKGYYFILKSILEKVIYGFMDYEYQQLFMEFWKESTDEMKSYVRKTECAQGDLLCEMFKIKDETDIILILEDATLPEKQKIYNSLLDFFVKECNISKTEMMKLKEKIVVTDEQQEKWLKFIEQLDSSDTNYKTKRTAENDNNSAKRLRFLESD